jgi:hypothetical protein
MASPDNDKNDRRDCEQSQCDQNPQLIRIHEHKPTGGKSAVLLPLNPPTTMRSMERRQTQEAPQLERTPA